MLRTLRPFFISLVLVLSVLIVAALLYSKRILPSSSISSASIFSGWIFSAALPAFACEAIFYLASTFKQTRELFKKLPVPKLQALLLWISALVPYLILSLGSHTFTQNSFYLLAGLSGLLSFWYVVTPRRAIYDMGFLVVAAAPQITGAFKRIYVLRQTDVLGHLAWIHVGIFALLVLRKWNPGDFSLWPTAREWQVGVMLFVVSIAPLIGLAQASHFARFVVPHASWWMLLAQGVGTFFGILWVVALSEELFFRGFIQRALENQRHSAPLAIAIAALLFGAAHLWVHSFPNWPYAAVAGLLGVACGIAYRWAGSVRASMVTHSLVVVTWRLFFQLR